MGIAGGWGSIPPVNVFNPPSCASLPVLGVRNNPHRSQLQTLICHHIPQVIEPCHCCHAYVPYSVIIQLQYHISIIKLLRSVIYTYMYCYSVTLLLKCQRNCGAMCTVYSTDFVRYTVLPLIRFGMVYCSLANALPHFRL